MGNIQGVKPAQQAQQTGTAKKVAITCAPLPMAGGIFVKALAEGKSASEAAGEVKKDFSETRETNKNTFKKGVKKAADTLEEHPIASVLCLGLFGVGIRALNKAIN